MLVTFHMYAIRIGCVVLGLAILELIRRNKLRENYALLWLCAAGGLFLLSIFPASVILLAGLLRLQYLGVVYLLSFLFLLIIVLCSSVTISKMSERIEKLAQETALLNVQLENLKKSSNTDFNASGRQKDD